MIRNLILVASSTILLLGKSASANPAESQSPTSSLRVTPRTSMPKREVYRVFFLQVVKLDAIASGLESQGKPQDGRELRSYFANMANLNSKHADDLLEIAREFETAIAKEDQASERYIKTTQALQSRGNAASVGDWNDNTQQRLNLVKSRENLIDLYISLLASKLGPTAFTKLNFYVITEFTKALTVTPLPQKENGL